MIKIKSLHKYFNKGRQNEIHVINDVNLELPQKGMIAIFGKSGCGKTTLLNVIGGLDKFHSGALNVNGEDITQNTDMIRNRDMGYIFQNYNLNKEESCFDNVANALKLCGIKDEALLEERVTAALRNVDMEKYAKRTPDTLSGGQQQRIAIARAIVKNPKIILADEPTGNLDEANTIMIMDLLKEISREHLVLLVTHEANLVDYYCDKVIELSDGKVIGVKVNENAYGYVQKDKNAIYLGEFEKTETQSENVEIEYYGESPETPIKVKIVNSNGKFYLKVESEGIQVLDGTGEIKLREGIYKQSKGENKEKNTVQMASLSPVEGTKFGTLFSFKSSLKSGYASFSKKQKKGKKLLRRCMILFAAVIVFMSAGFGTSIAQLIDAKDGYNHNVFYVYTPGGEVSEKINNAVGNSDSAIDYVRMFYDYPSGDSNIYFQTGAFETFSTDYYDSTFSANGVCLSASAAKDLTLVAGKKEDLKDTDVIITTKIASELLENSSLGYIKEYDDLLSLILLNFSIDGNNFRVSGIVESDESAFYIPELSMAKYVINGSPLRISNSSGFNMNVSSGEGILALGQNYDKVKLPAVGDIIKINGKDIKVSKILTQSDYKTWLENNKISKKEIDFYFIEETKKSNPNLIENSPEFNEKLEKNISENHFEYYDYYYSEIDIYLNELRFFIPDDNNLWLATEKNIDVAKYLYLPEEYYSALEYKKINGRYPKTEELKIISLDEINRQVEEYRILYDIEFRSGTSDYHGVNDISYILSDSDYIEMSKITGETHASAMFSYDKPNSVMDIHEYEEVEFFGEEYYTVSDYSGYFSYTLIHSNNPEVTKEWLDNNFNDLSTGSDLVPIVTPDDIFDNLVSRKKDDIIAGLISLGVILTLMSVCMYFIMRSSFMNRIKEIGIYRAIGVSKKNLVFKFLVESLVIASMTIFIGYIVSSGFIAVCLSLSPAVESLFFYPLWMAGIVLVILYALCLICGIIPILSMLRKTPSEILAKYDI